MDLEQALRTTGAVRDFTDQPVPDDLVYRILDTARFAPSGGNRQAWRAIVLHDQTIRRQLRDLYLTGWYEYLAMGQSGLVPWAPITDHEAEDRAVAEAGRLRAAAEAGGNRGMAEDLDRVPALIVIAADLRRLAAVDRDLDRYTLVGGASVYPFAWSILLAAHDHGLGGVITTMVVKEEDAVRELLGIPEEFAVAALMTLGYPAGKRPTRLERGPVEGFATVDRFDGAPLHP